MKYIIDLKRVKTQEQLHEVLKKKLELPDYYGGNLDALYDALNEKTKEMQIVFTHCYNAKKNLGEYFDSLKEIFVDLSKYNEKIIVDFKKNKNRQKYIISER